MVLIIHRVVVRGVLLVFEVLQYRRLDADVETPTLTITSRHPREVHLPTVQIPRKGYDTWGNLFCLEVETARIGYAPLFVLVEG